MNTLLEKLNTSRKPYKLGEIFELKYGFGLPERERKEGPVPVYGSSGVVGHHARAGVEQPSIVVGRKGNVGSVFYSPTASYPIDTAYFIDNPHKGFDLKYIYYLLNRVNLSRYGGDSAVPGLSRDAVYSIDVQVPDFAAQKKIASILGAYDAKIENNNAIIKNLEAIAQAIFKEWFVKFNFPAQLATSDPATRQSRNGAGKRQATSDRWVGYKDAGGKMVESDLGLIPEGWGVKSLDEVADFLNGVAIKKFQPRNATDVLPAIKIREMNSGIDSGTEKVTSEIDKKYIIKNGDVLFSWSGSLELMQWFGGDAALNQHIFKVTSDKYPQWFFYFLIKKAMPFFKVVASSKATTMGHIQRRHLTDWKVVVPEEKVIQFANKLIGEIFAKKVVSNLENVSLKASRDQLLKELI